MRKSMLTVLLCTLFGLSANAQSHTTLKAAPSVQKEKATEQGVARIRIIIAVEGKEIPLPEYVKEGVNYNDGAAYAKELMTQLKEKGAEIAKYDYDWSADRERKKETM